MSSVKSFATAAALGATALFGLGAALATPASAVGFSGCHSWKDSDAVKGYASCDSGPGSVRVVVKCIDSRGQVSSHEGSWVKATATAASVYSCGGTYAWVYSTSYQTKISVHE